jgi:HPt (histidine-containing phosphotransfer) domain-containing protein
MRETLGDEIFRSIMETMPSTLLDQAAQIEGFVRTGEFDEARRVAHSVKGMAGNFGLIELEQRARDLEVPAFTHDAVFDLLPAFSCAVAESRGALDRWLDAIAD